MEGPYLQWDSRNHVFLPGVDRIFSFNEQHSKPTKVATEARFIGYAFGFAPLCSVETVYFCFHFSLCLFCFQIRIVVKDLYEIWRKQSCRMLCLSSPKSNRTIAYQLHYSNHRRVLLHTVHVQFTAMSWPLFLHGRDKMDACVLQYALIEL